MDKLLKPQIFSTLPSEARSQNRWIHWKKTFDNFLSKCPIPTNQTALPDEDKLSLLTNYIDPDLFDYIVTADTYAEAITCLQDLYVKPVNEIFARHQLKDRKQQPAESLDSYLQALKVLAKKCNFQAVSAAEHQEQYTRDAFITGLQSNTIRQRLLESATLTLAQAFTTARSIDLAHKQSEAYVVHPSVTPDQSTTAAISENNYNLESASANASYRQIGKE